jgi:hypothetical protein
VIAFPLYKGIAEAVLHEIVILLAACLFRAALLHRGLDTRASIGPYLNNIIPPRDGAFQFLPVLAIPSNTAGCCGWTGLDHFAA